MSYEMINGLKILDDKKYSAYREAIAPILLCYNGGFRYDFKVSEVLKNQEGRPISRVFLLHFEDKSSKEAFFKDLEYQKIKSVLFESSVQSTTIIAEYER